MGNWTTKEWKNILRISQNLKFLKLFWFVFVFKIVFEISDPNWFIENHMRN